MTSAGVWQVPSQHELPLSQSVWPCDLQQRRPMGSTEDENDAFWYRVGKLPFTYEYVCIVINAVVVLSILA